MTGTQIELFAVLITALVGFLGLIWKLSRDYLSQRDEEVDKFLRDRVKSDNMTESGNIEDPVLDQKNMFSMFGVKDVYFNKHLGKNLVNDKTDINLVYFKMSFIEDNKDSFITRNIVTFMLVYFWSRRYKYRRVIRYVNKMKRSTKW